MSPIGTVRVRDKEDEYCKAVYLKTSDGYRVIHIDTQTGAILEASVSDTAAERWPIIWSPK